MEIFDFNPEDLPPQLAYNPVGLNKEWRKEMIEEWNTFYQEFLEKSKNLVRKTNGKNGLKLIVSKLDSGQSDIVLMFTELDSLEKKVVDFVTDNKTNPH